MLCLKKKQCICDSSASLQDATKCEFYFALSEVLEGGAVSPEGPDEMNRIVVDATILQNLAYESLFGAILVSSSSSKKENSLLLLKPLPTAVNKLHAWST